MRNVEWTWDLELEKVRKIMWFPYLEGARGRGGSGRAETPNIWLCRVLLLSVPLDNKWSEPDSQRPLFSSVFAAQAWKATMTATERQQTSKYTACLCRVHDNDSQCPLFSPASMAWVWKAATTAREGPMNEVPLISNACSLGQRLPSISKSQGQSVHHVGLYLSPLSSFCTWVAIHIT